MTLADRRLRNSVPRTSTDEWMLAVTTHWRVPSFADDRVQLRAGWQLAARRIAHQRMEFRPLTPRRQLGQRVPHHHIDEALWRPGRPGAGGG